MQKKKKVKAIRWRNSEKYKANKWRKRKKVKPIIICIPGSFLPGAFWSQAKSPLRYYGSGYRVHPEYKGRLERI